jgi:hypothetical protein
VEDDWSEVYASMAPLGEPDKVQVAGKRIFITLFNPASHGLAAN